MDDRPAEHADEIRGRHQPVTLSHPENSAFGRSNAGDRITSDMLAFISFSSRALDFAALVLLIGCRQRSVARTSSFLSIALQQTHHFPFRCCPKNKSRHRPKATSLRFDFLRLCRCTLKESLERESSGSLLQVLRVNRTITFQGPHFPPRETHYRLKWSPVVGKARDRSGRRLTNPMRLGRVQGKATEALRSFRNNCSC